MYSFDQITTFFVIFVALLGLIVLIANASSAIGKMKNEHDKPLNEVEERVDDLEDRMDKVEEKLDGDWDFRQEELEFNRLMLRSMKQIVKHLTVSSSDDKDRAQLEKVEGDIDGYLLDHQG